MTYSTYTRKLVSAISEEFSWEELSNEELMQSVLRGFLAVGKLEITSILRKAQLHKLVHGELAKEGRVWVH